MNARQFFDKVAEMRRLQKEYFKSKSPFVLDKSKKIEKEIDDEIKRVQAIESAKKQKSLFD